MLLGTTYPIVGRSVELEKLANTHKDVVLYGVPGCGKSRLVSELTGVAFVDKASAGEQLAPDIRWQQPLVIVVDDAGTAESLVKRLLNLRATEPDLTYRIIAICWPDEKDEVGAWLGLQAERIELDLIERQILDEIIIQMGISNERARTEILNQAEGRVGWAVALASLLLQTHDGISLLNGRALYGHVIDYLRRAKLNDRVQDVLALTAILDGLVQGDVNRAAELVGVLRSDFNDGLRLAAHGGLIDVVTTYGERSYHTRPPMLATVLVAERVFKDAVPSVSTAELLEKWPERRPQIFKQATRAAMLGAVGARLVADSLFLELIADGLPVELLSLYAMLDDQAAARAVDALVTVPRPISSYLSASVCRTYANIAYRFRNDEALMALLDLAVGDTRPTNPYPEHPYRLVEAHVQAFSPDSGHRFESRKWTIEVASEWLRQNQSEDAKLVYAAVTKACLSPKLTGQGMHPGNPNTLQLREAVLPPAWMAQVETELWPRVIEIADRGGQGLSSALIDVAAEWLDMGDGLTASIAQVGSESRQQARTTGAEMLQQVAVSAALSTGLAVRLHAVARRHTVSISAPSAPNKWGLFFVDPDPTSLARVEDLHTFVAIFRAWGADQVTRQPDDVVQELFELRGELTAAGLTWPDRVACALEGIAESVDNPLEWLEAAIERGLTAEALALVSAIFRHGEMTLELCQGFMASKYTRWTTIRTVLSATDAEAQLVDTVIGAVRESDYECLFTMLLREEDTPGIADRLMSHPRDEVSALAAYAYWDVSRHSERDGEFPAVWFEAIEKLRSDVFDQSHQDYAIPDLFLYMDSACPANLLSLLVRLLTDVATRRNFTGARDKWWSKLHELSPDRKSVLWDLFKDEPMARHILEWNLAGDDEAWLQAQLESGRLSSSDVLNFANGLAQSPSLETIARLLIPRGVEPKAIASRADLSDSFGERSSHYHRLVEKFAALVESGEIVVRQLGEAGVEIFSHQKEIEAEKERRRRIRGEL